MTISNGFWFTYYTRQGLLELCQFTPTINGFNLQNDLETFNKVSENLLTDKGIKISQNRFLIKASKPK